MDKYKALDLEIQRYERLDFSKAVRFGEEDRMFLQKHSGQKEIGFCCFAAAKSSSSQDPCFFCRECLVKEAILRGIVQADKPNNCISGSVKERLQTLIKIKNNLE